MQHQVPQPSPRRVASFRGGAIVAAVRPGVEPLVALTAADLARAAAVAVLAVPLNVVDWKAPTPWG
mgnify:CR=1 FL=1